MNLQDLKMNLVEFNCVLFDVIVVEHVHPQIINCNLILLHVPEKSKPIKQRILEPPLPIQVSFFRVHQCSVMVNVSLLEIVHT